MAVVEQLPNAVTRHHGAKRRKAREPQTSQSRNSTRRSARIINEDVHAMVTDWKQKKDVIQTWRKQRPHFADDPTQAAYEKQGSETRGAIRSDGLTGEGKVAKDSRKYPQIPFTTLRFAAKRRETDATSHCRGGQHYDGQKKKRTGDSRGVQKRAAIQNILKNGN